MQVALLDVMVQREEGLKRGKERMAAALDDMVAEGKAEYTVPVGQAAARDPNPKPTRDRITATGHVEDVAPIGQAAAGSSAVAGGNAGLVTAVDQAAAVDDMVWAGPGGLRAAADAA